LLTSKYGLHAERTTLWALRVFPSAARVQSTSVPLSRSVSKFCMSVLWWLFHLRQNCWSSSMVVLASFPRFCIDEKAWKMTYRITNVKSDNIRVRNLPMESSSLFLSLALFLLIVLSIDRATRRYLVLPRPIIIAHIEPNDVPGKVRLSTFVPIRQFSPVSLSLPLSLSSHAALAGGRRRQKLRNEAAKLPKWPYERCVGRIALLAFSFVRVW